VPYFSQWESPELAAEFIDGSRRAADDPRWADSGASTPEEYEFWSHKVCGLACLKMIMAWRGVPVPPRSSRAANHPPFDAWPRPLALAPDGAWSLPWKESGIHGEGEHMALASAPSIARPSRAAGARPGWWQAIRQAVRRARRLAADSAGRFAAGLRREPAGPAASHAGRAHRRSGWLPGPHLLHAEADGSFSIVPWSGCPARSHPFTTTSPGACPACCRAPKTRDLRVAARRHDPGGSGQECQRHRRRERFRPTR